jgi:hypothetical protein
METRICKVCKQEKFIEAFPHAGNGNKTNQSKHRRYKCQPCYQSAKNVRKTEIRQWFDEYKKQQQCLDCGIKDYRVFEFHHLGDDIKEGNLGDVVRDGWSRERISKELKKCVCLCANCHRIRHHEEKQSVAQLGRALAWGARGFGGSNPLTLTADWR